jgi:hypothetical protein
MTDPDVIHRPEISLDDGKGVEMIYDPSRDLGVTREEVTLVQYENVNITVNGTSFKPGDIVDIHTVADTSKVNGSVDWRLESPLESPNIRDAGLDEVPFDFVRDVTSYFFADPDFQNNETLEDWYNHTTSAFDVVSINSTLGELNLTRETGNNNEAILHYNKSIYPGSYLIQFDFKNITGADQLNFSYYNGGWVNVSLETSTNDWVNDFSQVIELSANSTDNDVFRFHLSSNATDSESTWLIRTLAIRYNFDKISISPNLQSGNISQQWQHRDFTETINSTYNIVKDESTSISDLAITIKLPVHSLYFGDWIFELIVTRKDPDAIDLDPVIYNTTITIQEDLNIGIASMYMKRGVNTTDDANTPIYENETGLVEVFSPGDRVVEIFNLTYSSSPEMFNTTYYNLNGFLINSWNNSYESLNWGQAVEESGIYGYNINAADLASGNFNNTDYNSSLYYCIRHDIPLRGIYGEVSRILNITFPSYNQRTVQVGDNEEVQLSTPLSINVSLSPITIKYRINITEESLPFSRQYMTTEMVEGNFTVGIWHYNQTLETLYSDEGNRSISFSLIIPPNDLRFEIFLNQSDQKSKISFSSSNYVFRWRTYLSPNLDTRKQFEIRVDWLDARDFGDESTLEFIERRASYELIGGLRIELANNDFEVRRFEDLSFNFTVILEETNKTIKDLLLHGEIDDLDWKINIQDNNGLYTCSITIDALFPVGEHEIRIIKSSTDEELAIVSFTVDNEIPENPIVLENTLLSLVGVTTFGLILLVFLVAVIFRRQ